jgi:hypothetical protein
MWILGILELIPGYNMIERGQEEAGKTAGE